MTAVSNSASIYALYLHEAAVELRLASDSSDSSIDSTVDSTVSRNCLFSKEKSYYAALDFGRDLAAYKGVPFINHVTLIQADALKPPKMSNILSNPRHADPRRLVQPEHHCFA